MKNTLVAYFSASGTTAKVAEKLAKAVEADIFEIRPEIPYTKEDLDWMDNKSRSTVEMRDKTSRVAIAGKVENMDQYDMIFLGFPIWWYVAPHIINSFLEQYDLADKKIVLFATSGSSGMGKTTDELRMSAPGAEFIGEKRFDAAASEKELGNWAYGFK